MADSPVSPGNREHTLAVVRTLLIHARERDIDAVAACYAEDAVIVSPLFGELRGRDRIAANWQSLFNTFVDVSINFGESMVDGNRVAVFGTLSTIDRLGWFGRPPTGSAITYRIVLMFTVVDGRVVRDERLYDSAGLLERLEKARVDKELLTAREVQRALVPKAMRSGPFGEWIGNSLPCRAIGGDFFEFIDLPSGNVGVLLGDVSGKGPAAALLAALIQGMFSVEAASADSPSSILARINRRVLERQLESRFATLVYGVLSSGGRFVYANAGHNPPVLLSNGSQRRLSTGGPAVGMLDNAVFEEETVSMHRGDTIVMFSDGVTEARNPGGEEFGDERLIAIAQAHRAAAPRELMDHVFAAVQSFSQDAEPTDDITVAVTRFAGM